MSEVVIYKKKYPQKTVDELLNAALSPVAAPKIIAATPISERRDKTELFIRTATDISARFELDLTVLCHDFCIEAVFSFDSAVNMRCLKPMFEFADDFSFFTDIYDRDITVSLQYYTHEVRTNGEITAP